MARSNESQNEEDPGTPYFVVFIYDLLAYYVHKDNTASRHELIATNQSEFTIEAPPTRIGRTRKSRNMDELNECLCGLAVAQEDRVNNSMTAVQCGYRGCEPGWVGSFSVFFMLKS